MISQVSMAQLGAQAAAMTVVEEIGYGREITGSVRGFVRVRIGSLRLGTAGRFLGGGHPPDFGALLGSNVVLEIEDCGGDRDRAFITGGVLLRLAGYLRIRARAEGRQGVSGPGQPPRTVRPGTLALRGAAGGRKLWI